MFNIDNFYNGDITSFSRSKNYNLGIKWEDTKIEYNNNTNNKKCVVIIPIYRKVPNEVETQSLKQVVKILGGKYDLVLVCPKNFDVEPYNKIGNYNFSILRCTNDYFKSQKAYSDLCEEWKFYEAFNEYEFMVIYQLDAWIFEDKIEYFMNMNYDYIGAVHLIGVAGNGREGENGNGGFCLRKIQKFMEVCKKTDFSKFASLEDCVFTQKLKSNFRLAPLNVCRQFSFQDKPSLCFMKNGNKLPMGCHAFKKFEWSFWKKYINIYGDAQNAKVVKQNNNLTMSMNDVLSSVYGPILVKKVPVKRRVIVKKFRN